VIEPEVSETIACYDGMAEHFVIRTMGLAIVGLQAFAARMGGRRVVLDLGCGPGRDTRRLAEAGAVAVGLDLSTELLRIAGRNHPPGAFVLGDMRSLPFGSGVFDGVWFNASLLHIPRAHAAAVLEETRRLCRSGAPLYLAVQAGEGERWWPDEHGGRRFFCYWSEQSLGETVGRAGFAIERIDEVVDSQRPTLQWLNLWATAS
jgi:SAM-dependent methyltransferase